MKFDTEDWSLFVVLRYMFYQALKLEQIKWSVMRFYCENVWLKQMTKPISAFLWLNLAFPTKWRQHDRKAWYSANFLVNPMLIGGSIHNIRKIPNNFGKSPRPHDLHDLYELYDLRDLHDLHEIQGLNILHTCLNCMTLMTCMTIMICITCINYKACMTWMMYILHDVHEL